MINLSTAIHNVNHIMIIRNNTDLKGRLIMALQLMKLLVTASTTTDVVPTPEKFFHVTAAETAAGATLSIDTADFFDDAGAAATDLPVLTTDNSYFNVYVNGVLQMEGISTYTPGATTVGSLDIDVPAGGDPILAGTPIVLEVINYAPTSTTTVET
jgi:hypothetical protein